MASILALCRTNCKIFSFVYIYFCSRLYRVAVCCVIFIEQLQLLYNNCIAQAIEEGLLQCFI